MIAKHNIRKILETANSFLFAARRCMFSKGQMTKDTLPLMVPEFVNRAFACELYLKAVILATKNENPKGHRLDKLFLVLKKTERKEIYDIWRDKAGENIPDCDYAYNMFMDNLEACRDVFARFRYVHEWAGATISLEASFVPEQFHLIDNFNVHSGFLEQFALALKLCAEKHIGVVYNSYD